MWICTILFFLKQLIDCSCKWIHFIQMREMINFHQTCFQLFFNWKCVKKIKFVRLFVKYFTRVLQQIKQSNIRFWSWISIFFQCKIVFWNMFYLWSCMWRHLTSRMEEKLKRICRQLRGYLRKLPTTKEHRLLRWEHQRIY